MRITCRYEGFNADTEDTIKSLAERGPDRVGNLIGENPDTPAGHRSGKDGIASQKMQRVLTYIEPDERIGAALAEVLGRVAGVTVTTNEE